MKPFKEFAFNYMEDLQHALDHLDLNKVAEATKLIGECRGTIWLIGNGGSAALASHMATDLQLAGKRAVALTDIAAVTTYANDRSYNDCFAAQLDRLSQPEDLLVAISGSGNSKNLRMALWAHRGKTIAITGFKGGELGKVADLTGFKGVHINVPANHMGVAQDGHQVVLHMVCYYLIERLKVQ